MAMCIYDRVGQEKPLPIHFSPEPEESIASWEIRLAEENCLTVNDLYGLPVGRSKQWRTPERLIGNSNGDILSRERWSFGEFGLTPTQEKATGLSDIQIRNHAHCPACLAQMSVKFQRAVWNRPWVLHCTIHDIPLQHQVDNYDSIKHSAYRANIKPYIQKFERLLCRTEWNTTTHITSNNILRIANDINKNCEAKLGRFRLYEILRREGFEINEFICCQEKWSNQKDFSITPESALAAATCIWFDKPQILHPLIEHDFVHLYPALYPYYWATHDGILIILPEKLKRTYFQHYYAILENNDRERYKSITSRRKVLELLNMRVELSRNFTDSKLPEIKKVYRPPLRPSPRKRFSQMTASKDGELYYPYLDRIYVEA